MSESTPLEYTELGNRELAEALRTSSGAGKPEAHLREVAARRIERLTRLSRILGLVAPAGTAPRTALEQIYDQSAEGTVEETPIVLDLRRMLSEHWEEWTPALREAEGLQPAAPDTDSEF